MARIVTLKLLIDEPDESKIHQEIAAMIGMAQQPVDDGNCPWLVDWTIESTYSVHKELDDSITNETYQEGDCARNWLAFSATKANESDSGYWSNAFGWTSFDLATRYDCAHINAPRWYGAEDVVLMLEPNNV